MGEVIGVLLSDPGDFQLPKAGICRIRDFESGMLMEVDAGDGKTRQLYYELKMKEYHNTLERR